MEKVSGGAYPILRTNKELALSVESDGFSVSSEQLSAGTRDAAYLCLRLALMERLFRDELPPLLLDESLCQLDDKRASGALTALASFGDSAQCLLFTCHTREERLCRELGIEFERIKL